MPASCESETWIEEELRTSRVAGVDLRVGRVSVTEQVVGYHRNIFVRDFWKYVDIDTAELARRRN